MPPQGAFARGYHHTKATQRRMSRNGMKTNEAKIIDNQHFKKYLHIKLC